MAIGLAVSRAVLMAATMPSPTTPSASKLRFGFGSEELTPRKMERRLAKDDEAFCSAAGSRDLIFLAGREGEREMGFSFVLPSTLPSLLFSLRASFTDEEYYGEVRGGGREKMGLVGGIIKGKM
jgi:hypothetical protein